MYHILNINVQFPVSITHKLTYCLQFCFFRIQFLFNCKHLWPVFYILLLCCSVRKLCKSLIKAPNLHNLSKYSVFPSVQNLALPASQQWHRSMQELRVRAKNKDQLIPEDFRPGQISQNWLEGTVLSNKFSRSMQDSSHQ